MLEPDFFFRSDFVLIYEHDAALKGIECWMVLCDAGLS